MTSSTKQIVETFLADFSADPSAAVGRHLHDQAEWTVMGTRPTSGRYSKSAFNDMVKPMNEAFSSFEVNVLATTVEGDRVAVEAEAHGQFVDGRRYHSLYHFLFVVREGSIREVKEYGCRGPGSSS